MSNQDQTFVFYSRPLCINNHLQVDSTWRGSYLHHMWLILVGYQILAHFKDHPSVHSPRAKLINFYHQWFLGLVYCVWLLTFVVISNHISAYFNLVKRWLNTHWEINLRHGSLSGWSSMLSHSWSVVLVHGYFMSPTWFHFPTPTVGGVGKTWHPLYVSC